jgi:hypothetical protein
MKGRIKSVGGLVIERKGKEIIQVCCYKNGYCGDHCPHFREPIEMGDVTAVKICQGTVLEFEKLIDERYERGEISE